MSGVSFMMFRCFYEKLIFPLGSPFTELGILVFPIFEVHFSVFEGSGQTL